MGLNPRAIWRAVFNVYARSVCVSPPLQTPCSSHFMARFAVLTLEQPRCYSSKNDNYNGLNSTTNQNDHSVVDDDVSTEELKRKIDKFYEGDVESLPSIFEAILKRKLSGRHEGADDELMKEIRLRLPGQMEDFRDEECDSDLNGFKETDEEIDDFSHARDSSDSEEEDREV